MAIDKIPTREQTYEDTFFQKKAKAKKLFKNLVNNAGVVVGVFISFAVLLLVTTDVRLTSFDEVSSLGIEFFLFLFCAYSMYVSCSDSGMRAGLASKVYISTDARYELKKQAFIDRKMQSKMHEFCSHYVAEELRYTRTNIVSIVGLTHEEYEERFMRCSKEEIKSNTRLTKAAKKAIIHANSIKPITLLPEMILRKGRRDSARSPLGMDPRTKKKIQMGVKLITTIGISLGLATILFDVVMEPSVAMFTEAVVKTLVVIINGFNGYRLGFANIAVDTVDFISDQTDLLEEATKYIEHNYPSSFPPITEK